MPWFHLTCAGFLLFAMNGCVTPQPATPPKPPTPEPTAKNSYWQGDGVTGESSILIDLTAQRAHFFKGAQEVGQSLISSGKKGFETPPGEFKITQKNKNHVSNLYGDFVNAEGLAVERNVDVTKQKPPEGASFQGSKMPYFLRFNGGVGMHAGRLPGRPASHGCVRLPRLMAEHFFETAAIGTSVTVKP